MTNADVRLTFPEDRVLDEPTSGSGDAALSLLYAHPARSVRLNLVASAEGKASGPDGSSRSINGPADLRVLRAIRSWADVVLVGARTARDERYTDLRVSAAVRSERQERGQAPQPQLAVVTWSGELPPDLSPRLTWVVSPAQAPAARAIAGQWAERLMIAGDADFEPAAAIAGLRHAGMSRIVCEGGPLLASWLLEAEAVDEYCLTRSPLDGADTAALIPDIPRSMALAHRLESDGFQMERWLRSARG